MNKPADVFNRDREWAALDGFVRSPRAGATLGLVYGRRRQGKTFLLEALAEAGAGFYCAALQQSSAQNLARFAVQYQAFTGIRVPVAFGTWEDAMRALLALGEGRRTPVAVVIDEFPYLLDGNPELPSMLQALLSPRGAAARGWPARLILCGSALSTMGEMLGGTAPLRGRAVLELMVHPFGYRDAAAFWGVGGAPEVAMRLHALVGGTPAYRDMCRGHAPGRDKEFDAWVVATLLDPASAMFREGSVLLAEEPDVRNASVYLAVLTAISSGHTRRSEIAAAVGKAEGALTHPLTVLTEARLVSPLADALRQKRTTYHIAEPVLRLHQLVIAPNEARLGRGQARAVWAELADTVSSRIYGPHFETLARAWCAEHADPATLGGGASRVGATEVACREHGRTHELDVVVLEVRANRGSRISAIGEAKWRTEPVGAGQLARLEHLRNLLGAPDAKLLLFSRTGASRQLVSLASARDDVEIIDADRLYTGT
ncbi:MAG TPA: ATP-binding protein [Mycobacteriales bacterium]|nr:ATP-binding protein [Mycobacteriales bacterium]